MSRHFFSLLHAEKLQVAPGTKRIPEESIAKIIEAEDLLKTVQIQAEEFRANTAAECETLKEEAKKKGFEAGYSDWVQKIAQLEQEIQAVRKETENIIFPIALAAAKKIVGRELEISTDAMIDIISQSLKSVASHKKIKIYVNRKDFEDVERKKEDLKKIFEHLEALSIIPQENIGRAGCIIETEGGIINAQLENQWIVLENAFQKFAKNSPKTLSQKTERAAEPLEEKTPSTKNIDKEQKEKQEEEEEEEEEEEKWEEEV